jgi:hypothetical protein
MEILAALATCAKNLVQILPNMYKTAPNRRSQATTKPLLPHKNPDNTTTSKQTARLASPLLLASTSNPLKEYQMKLLLATMFKKVPVRKAQRRATLCKRCGARIFTLSYLKAHLETHATQRARAERI